MALRPTSSGAFLRGVDASTSLYVQPRGSVPRASNLILTKRGDLTTCDGSAIVNAFLGAPQPNRGRDMCDILFQPIGVAPYYLRIMKLLDHHLGVVTNLAASDGGGSGSGLNGTYFWKVTAVDGTGGETAPSLEVTATIASGHVATLTWNIVPNAVGYNVYRSTTTGTETLISSPKSPITGTVAQVAPGTLTVTFTDTGVATDGTTAPPNTDTTQQTGMYAMFTVYSGGNIVSYSDANLEAIWPADVRFIDGEPGGGSGGGGGTGGGQQGQPGVTPVGSFPPGNVSFLPQMQQFVNRVCIALGNAYPPQIFSDNTGSPDSPAKQGTISSISTDAAGVVTVTCSAPHGLTAANVGACVFIGTLGVNGAGISDPVYYGVYITIAIPSTTTFKIRNLAAIGHGTATGGYTITTVPIFNTFQPQFPKWVASSSYALNSVVVPTTGSPADYFQAIAPANGGMSSATEPTWPSALGATVQDGNITWRNAGAVASAAPPPPGCAHLTVYSGALWVFDTSPVNTTNGLDGPTVLRMSDVNEPNSWNPVNCAFIDKDDGTEGMGLTPFTITAQGIPPQGSLILCKLYATYQVLGVFGSSNFAIQRVITDLGCLAPRSLQFIPGFGVGRYTHLGIAIFDGTADRLVSPQVNPYLFPSNDPELADIVVADSNWISLSWGAQTANPPMYCLFIPIGSSGGALTRALCFDLVLKSWSIVDLPFPVSTAYQAKTSVSNPITLLGSFSDGTLQRWQAGDILWATANGSGVFPPTAPVSWSVRSPSIASKDPDERLYARRCVVRGQLGTGGTTVTINPRARGVSLGAQSSALPAAGLEFAAQAALGVTSDRFDAVVAGTGDVTISSIDIQVTPKPIGLLTGQMV